LGVALVLVLLGACSQSTDNSTTAEDKAATVQSLENAFQCTDYTDALKLTDPKIQVAQNLRPINQREKDAISYYNKYINGADQSTNYVLKQKIPGKIKGICFAEAFFSDGTNYDLIFTIADTGGNEFLAFQDTSALKEAFLLLNIAEATKKENEAQEQPQNAIQPNEAVSTDVVTSENLAPKEPHMNNEAVSTAKTSPSFNCEKASTSVEKMICSESSLAKLDNQIASSYKDALKNASGNSGQIENLKQSQKQWLKTRNQCSSSDCLAKSYEDRNKELAPWEYEL